jgi:hypothetical protein
MHSDEFIEKLVDAVGSALGVETGMCSEHRFKAAFAAARALLPTEAPASLSEPYEILRSMLRAVALSDHLGDVHGAIDDGLQALGLPLMPVDSDGSMSCRGWLDNAKHVCDWKAPMATPLFSEAYRAVLVAGSPEVAELRARVAELQAERG